MTEKELKEHIEKRLFDDDVEVFKPWRYRLTNREHFALEFAKILLEKDPMSYKLSAGCSVELADELIKALNEEKG